MSATHPDSRPGAAPEPGRTTAERRRHRRVVLNQLCTLHFADLPTPVHATIIDVSSSGMRLRVPRIREQHLAQGFRVQCRLNDKDLTLRVHRLYAASAHEIAVRLATPGTQVEAEITRFVFARLRGDRDAQALRSREQPAVQAPSREPLQVRRGLERRYQSRGGFWLSRRTATHFDLD